MNIVAIVQARMGSSRLPGKVLLDIANKPVLWHVLTRLSQCKLINNIVIATSDETTDDIIESFCKNNLTDFYRGKQADVLDRYFQAAKAFNADVVVRITSDCPFIDPVITDKVISAYLENRNKFDGASNVVRRTYPRGLDTEVFPTKVIERVWQLTSREDHREHVTKYIYDHPELFRILSVEDIEDHSGLRWTLDEQDDFIFVKEIYKRIYSTNRPFLMSDVLKILQQEPQLKKINMNVKQKY